MNYKTLHRSIYLINRKTECGAPFQAEIFDGRPKIRWEKSIRGNKTKINERKVCGLVVDNRFPKTSHIGTDLGEKKLTEQMRNPW